MKQTLALAAVAALTLTSLIAAVPPPDKLLPDDTLAVFTMPDKARALQYYANSPGAKLWADTEIKAFKDKFIAKFQKEIIAPMEHDLGVKFSDYTDLIQGQVTLALARGEWDGSSKTPPSILLIIDSGDKSALLKKTLDDLQKRWVDAGKQIKTTRVRNVDLMTLVVNSEDVAATAKAAVPDPNDGWESLAGPKKKAVNRQWEVLVGQADSVLVVGTDAVSVEKVLSHLAGGVAPALGDSASFASSYNAQFRDAVGYGWVDLKSLIDLFSADLAKQPQNRRGGPNPATMMDALGVKALGTASFSMKDAGDGTFMQLFVAAPAAERKGLLKMFLPEPKDASPPAFVPADAVKFTRVRVNLQNTWAEIENTATAISPQVAAFMRMSIDSLGKTKEDPTFDLRKNLIANLGDDFIFWSMKPHGTTFQEMNNPPVLFLLSSPNAEKLSASLPVLVTSLGRQGNLVKTRELLGRKVYSLDMGPAQPLPGAPDIHQPNRSLSFAASGGYLVFALDDATLEDYLRNGAKGGKALRDKPGLAAAAGQVGGMNNGFFAYENQSESMRAMLEVLKNDSGAIMTALSMIRMNTRMGGDRKSLTEWLDFSLLPEYDKIGKYFNFTVTGLNTDDRGMTFKVYAPNPPGLK